MEKHEQLRIHSQEMNIVVPKDVNFSCGKNNTDLGYNEVKEHVENDLKRRVRSVVHEESTTSPWK